MDSEEDLVFVSAAGAATGAAAWSVGNLSERVLDPWEISKVGSRFIDNNDSNANSNANSLVEDATGSFFLRSDLERVLESFLVSDPSLVCLCAPMVNVSVWWLSVFQGGHVVHMLNLRVLAESKERSEVEEEWGSGFHRVSRSDWVKVGYNTTRGTWGESLFSGVEAHCVQLGLSVLYIR